MYRYNLSALVLSLYGLVGCMPVTTYLVPSDYTASYRSIRPSDSPLVVNVEVEHYNRFGVRHAIIESILKDQVLDVFEATGGFVATPESNDQLPTFKLVVKDTTDAKEFWTGMLGKEVTTASFGLIGTGIDTEQVADISLTWPDGKGMKLDFPYSMPVRYGRHEPPDGWVEVSVIEQSLEPVEKAVLNFVERYQHENAVMPASAVLPAGNNGAAPQYFRGVLPASAKQTN